MADRGWRELVDGSLLRSRRQLAAWAETGLGDKCTVWENRHPAEPEHTNLGHDSAAIDYPDQRLVGVECGAHCVQLVAYDNVEVGIVAALPLSSEQVAEINARSHFVGIPVDQFEDRYFLWLGAGEHAHTAEDELCAPPAKVEESLAQALQAGLAASMVHP